MVASLTIMVVSSGVDSIHGSVSVEFVVTVSAVEGYLSLGGVTSQVQEDPLAHALGGAGIRDGELLEG